MARILFFIFASCEPLSYFFIKEETFSSTTVRKPRSIDVMSLTTITVEYIFRGSYIP